MTWNPNMDEAPYSTPVQVKLESGQALVATLYKNGSVDENEVPCDQWVARGEDYPRCWSDGACWSSNADDYPSMPPIAWMPLPPPPEQTE